MTLFFFGVVMICSTYSYSLTSFSQQSSPIPPYDGVSWVVHYDAATRKIWMLAGMQWDTTALEFKASSNVQTFDIDTNTWNIEAATPNLTIPQSQQSFASIGDTVYFVGHNGTFGSFNVQSNTFFNPHPNITLLHPAQESCLTTDGFRYIFIISGWIAGNYVPQFQIYDIQNNEWLTGNIPNVNIPRAYHSCEYHKGYIYIFGGWIGNNNDESTATIEKIYVSSGDDVLSTVTTQTWTVLPVALDTMQRQAMSAKCSDVDADEIYIIGGFHRTTAPPRDYMYDTVQIFDTAPSDPSITTSSVTLNTPRAAGFAICIEDYLYVMLGYNECGSKCRTKLFNWEVSNALYTFSPTNNPTSNVNTLNPTLPLSNNPTLSPTSNPTLTPTKYPTLNPIKYPTKHPTSTPTLNPTLTPTKYPTLIPSDSPLSHTTANPTMSPSNPSAITTNPTSAPILSLNVANVVALFSCSYLELYLEINDVLITTLSPLMFTCLDILDTTTNTLLSDSVCSWSNNRRISISLSATSTISINSNMTIKPAVFAYSKHNEWVAANAAILIPDIQRECDISPQINVNMVSSDVIGICDDLMLDARGAISNLGGRNPASIWWDVTVNGMASSFDTDHVLIQHKEIDPDSIVYYSLRVKTWYNESAAINATITKSRFAILSIQLIAPSVFDADSKQIVIQSLIASIDSCLNASNALSLSYSWNVIHQSSIAGSDTFDNERFAELESFIHSNSDKSLVIDTDRYLQKGAEYQFIFNANNESESVEIKYEYSAIICQISGGNKMYTLPISSIPRSMRLDGDSWSYDPDNNALSFEWNCQTDCSHFLSSSSSAVTSIALSTETFEVGSSYIYEFVLTVSDSNVGSRAPCTDSITLQLDIVADHDNDGLLVSLSATATAINVADKLKLIGVVTYLNGTEMAKDNNLFYEWSTANELLTVSQIQRYQINEYNQKYLVLDSNVLAMGTNYEFILSVYDNSLIFLGSSSINIYVKSRPMILENGFTVHPICNKDFNHFKESLFYAFNLYALADGDYPPFLYTFNMLVNGAQNAYYLHSYPQTVPYLRNVMLPIRCNLSLIANVFDSQKSMDSDSINCCLKVLTKENDCFSYERDIINVYIADNLLLSRHHLNRYVLQTAFNVLDYLANIENIDCKYNHFKEVVNVLALYFSDLDNYLFVIQLSQTLCKWLSVGIADPVFLTDLIEDEDGDYFAVIYELLREALDPRRTITDIVATTSGLSVSSESVVTNKIIVLYHNVDITNDLSILLTDSDYFPLLYECINVFVEYLSIYTSQIMENAQSEIAMTEVVVFLDKVLYIIGLASISTAIPTEYANITLDNFQIYTARNETSAIDVHINDVEIMLDLEAEADKPKDLIIFAISVEPETNVTYFDKKCHFEGDLDKNKVSVTILNNTNSSNLNITLKFQYNDNDDGIICVWWNEDLNEWDSSGCYTQFDVNNELIVCRCDHLTTFATISNLHSDGNKCNDTLLNNNSHGIAPYIMLIFAILFCILLSWILAKLFRYKFMFKKALLKTKPLQVVITCAIITFLQIIICSFYAYSFQSETDDFYVMLFTIILLIPFVLYYFMFTIVISTWMNVAHSMNKSDFMLRFKYLVKLSTIPVAVLLLLIIILLISLRNDSDAKNTAIMIGEISWCVIMTLLVIVFSIYGYKMINILHTANKMDGDKTSESHKAERRLTMVLVTICIFFIVQSMLTSYFSIQPNALNVYWRMVDLLINFICLVMICWMYHRKLNREQGDDQESVGSFSPDSKNGIVRIELSQTGTQRIKSKDAVTAVTVTPTYSPKVAAFAYNHEQIFRVSSHSTNGVIPDIVCELNRTLTPS